MTCVSLDIRYICRLSMLLHDFCHCYLLIYLCLLIIILFLSIYYIIKHFIETSYHVMHIYNIKHVLIRLTTIN